MDYSSQDDDVSPSIFHDNCEEVIGYIESLMKYPNTTRKLLRDDVNDRYNMAARNSLIDMDWRVLKYGENILLGEIKKFVDFVADVSDKLENKRKREIIYRLKVNNDLDNEMKRMSQVIEDMDTDIEEITVTNVTNIKNITNITNVVEMVPSKKPKVEGELTSPVFRVKKVKPVNLSVNLDVSPETSIFSPDIQKQKDESTELVVKPEVKTKEAPKLEFWNMFRDDSEWWKGLAKRNLEKMEETRKELARFSGHELVLGEFQNEIDRFEKEKAKLQSFINDVDRSKAVNKDLEYDKKYEDMVLKLIEFAKKDFIFKGFDPLIQQLKDLSNIKVEQRKKKVNIQDIINIYTQIDITKYSYEELCLLEKYYKEIIRKYKTDHLNKENIHTRHERSPSLVREVENRSAPPSYHRNVILNLNSTHNLTKNINSYSNQTLFNGDSLKRSKRNQQRSQNNIEIFDLTRTYPMEYYANNWWSIYEDVLKSREQQFGSIDNWWKFYEAVLNKEDTNNEELERIRAVVEYRNSLRRPHSRLGDLMKRIDEVKTQSFREEEDVQNRSEDSVRYCASWAAWFSLVWITRHERSNMFVFPRYLGT